MLNYDALRPPLSRAQRVLNPGAKRLFVPSHDITELSAQRSRGKTLGPKTHQNRKHTNEGRNKLSRRGNCISATTGYQRQCSTSPAGYARYSSENYFSATTIPRPRDDFRLTRYRGARLRANYTVLALFVSVVAKPHRKTDKGSVCPPSESYDF